MIDLALIVNAIVFVSLFVFLLQRGSISIYSGLFVYLVFHFVVFVQRPIVVHYFDLKGTYYYMDYMPTDDVFLTTLLVANVGLISFIFGYLATAGLAPLKPNFIVPSITPIQRRAFWISLALLSPLILYSFYLAFTLRQAYGTEALSELGQLELRTDPTTGAHLFVDTSAYIVGARNMLLPFATLLIIVTRGKLLSYLPLLGCAFVALQLGERWLIVVSCLVAVLLSLYFRRRQQFTAPQYLLIGLVLVIFVVLGQNRDAVANLILNGDIDFNFDLEKSSLGDHLDFANFEFLNYVIGKVPDVSGTYSYFSQYLGLFTQPIPRMLWPDKPVGSPIVLVNLDAYGRFVGLSTSLVGDGWMSLGYLGVVVTTSAVGAFYGWLFNHFCRPAISIYFFCAYFWMLALLLQWARDGSYRITDFFFFSLVGLVIAFALERLVFRQNSPRKPTSLRPHPPAFSMQHSVQHKDDD